MLVGLFQESKKEAKTLMSESECSCQDMCDDFYPSKSGKTCTYYNSEDGECYYACFLVLEDEFE